MARRTEPNTIRPGRRGRVENLQRDGRPVAGAEQGNTRALVHGERSELTVKKVATVQKRRMLRQIGLRQVDLTGIGLAFLGELRARAQAKVELMDADYERRGFLDRRGKPRASVSVYFTSLNSVRRSLAEFSKYLQGSAVSSTPRWWSRCMGGSGSETRPLPQPGGFDEGRLLGRGRVGRA